jgi:hypothetical protein
MRGSSGADHLRRFDSNTVTIASIPVIDFDGPKMSQRSVTIVREDPELLASAAIAKRGPGAKVNRANWNDLSRAFCDNAKD